MTGAETTSGGNFEGDESLWTQLLQRSRRSTDAKECDVIVLGDCVAERRSLLSELSRRDSNGVPKNSKADIVNPPSSGPSHSLPLESTYWELESDVGSAPKVSFRSMSNPSHSSLLKLVAPKQENLSRLSALLVVNLSKPSSVMSSLEQWIEVLSNFVEERAESLKIDLDLLKQQVEQQWRAPPTSTVPQSPGGDEQESDGIQLGEGVLEGNIGIPVTIVAVNSHVYAGESVDEEALDFVQYHLRKLAIRIGAGIVYCSLSTGVGLPNLAKYLWYTMLPEEFPLELKPEIVDRPALFLPLGWDRMEVLSTLVKPALQSLKPEEFFSAESRTDQRNPDASANHVEVPDEQSFLAKLLAKQKLMGDMAPKPKSRTAKVAMASSSTSDTVTTSGAADKENPAVIASFFQSLLSRDKDDAAGTSSSANKPTTRKSQRVREAAEKQGGDMPKSEDE